MVQETKFDAKEILFRLDELRKEVEYLKSHMNLRDSNFESEMKSWENASLEDNNNFFKKHDL